MFLRVPKDASFPNSATVYLGVSVGPHILQSSDQLILLACSLCLGGTYDLMLSRSGQCRLTCTSVQHSVVYWL